MGKFVKLLLFFLTVTGGAETYFSPTLKFDDAGRAHVIIDRAAGNHLAPPWKAVPILVRLNSEGNVDSKFAGEGAISVGTLVRTQADFAIWSVTIDALASAPSGGLLVAGHYATENDYGGFVVRLTRDGKPDSSFGTKGVVLAPSLINALDDYVFAVNSSTDGSLTLGIHHEGDNLQASVVRLEKDGTNPAYYGDVSAVRFAGAQLPGGSGGGSWRADTLATDAQGLIHVGGGRNGFGAVRNVFVAGVMTLPSSLDSALVTKFSHKFKLSPALSEWLREDDAQTTTHLSAPRRRVWFQVENILSGKNILYELSYENGKMELVGKSVAKAKAERPANFHVVDGHIHSLREGSLFRMDLSSGKTERVSGPYVIEEPGGKCSGHLEEIGLRFIQWD